MRTALQALQLRLRNEEAALIEKRAHADAELAESAQKLEKLRAQREAALAAAQAAKAQLAKARQNAYAAADELEAKAAANQEAMIKMQKAAKANEKLQKLMASASTSQTALRKLAGDMANLKKQSDRITTRTLQLRKETEDLVFKKHALQTRLDDMARRQERKREMGIAMPDTRGGSGNAGGNAMVTMAKMQAEIDAMLGRIACLRKLATKEASASRKSTGTAKPAVQECLPPGAKVPAAPAKASKSKEEAAAEVAEKAAALAADSQAAVAAATGTDGGDDVPASASGELKPGVAVWFDPDTGKIVDESYTGNKVKGRIVNMVQPE